MVPAARQAPVVRSAAWTRARHGVPNADAVDLILDMKYFDTLLPALAEEHRRMQARELPDGWDAELPTFPAEQNI